MSSNVINHTEDRDEERIVIVNSEEGDNSEPFFPSLIPAKMAVNGPICFFSFSCVRLVLSLDLRTLF